MAEDSEQIGGISVTLGASDAKLVSDLANAERLVQQSIKQMQAQATISIGARYAGGPAGAGGGGGGDLSALTKAIEQGFAAASARPPARPQPAPRPVYGAAAGTAAASQQGQTALQRAINQELAKTGDAYDEMTGEIVKVNQAHRAQRTAIESSTRSYQNAEVAAAPSVDTGALQAEIKTLVGALAEFRAALATAAESAVSVTKAPARATATAATATSPGYHAGDLGYGKDTTLGRMTPGRGSGHFGTGSYFVSDPSKITGRGDRPVQSADFAGRNLYTPKTKAAALQLHDALKLANDENAEAAQQALQKIFPKIADTAVSEAVSSAKADIGKKGYVESISTRIMRKLGYEGVDVRHLPDLDNTQFGSVIYGESAAGPPVPSAAGAGRGGGRRRGGTRNAAPPPGGDEDEEEGAQPTQTLYAATEQFRRQQGARDPLGTRLRPAIRAKRTAQDVHYQRQQRTEEQARLQALIDQNAASGSNVRTSASFAGGSSSGPPAPVARTQQNETPAERQRRERDERDQAQALAANAPRQRRRLAPEQSALRAAQQRQEQLFAQQRAAVVSPEEREARIQEAIEAGRANVAAGTSTGRTSASRIASVLGGTGGRRLEADVRAAAARRELNAANRVALPFEREIAVINDDIANSTPRVAAGLRAQRDAFRSDPKVVEAFKRQEQAIIGVANATREYEKLQSGSNIVRNLGAIALGSFAFSAALKAVDVAVTSLTPAIGSYIDEQTGFAATSTRVTSALASQTLALHGNVDAALAAAEAQAGLSGAAASALSDQLKLTTSVKAGALAQQQASELFRAAAGTGQGAPQGLFGGFGGLGGSALLGQQFGGGKGFTEQLSGDINALRGGGGKSPLDDIASGLSYITNQAVKDAVNQAAVQQGNSTFDAAGFAGRTVPPLLVANAINDFIGGKNPIEETGRQIQSSNIGGPATAPEPIREKSAAEVEAAANNTKLIGAYLTDLGKAAERGAPFVKNAAVVTYDYAKSVEEQTAGARAAAAAGDTYGYALATQSNIIVRANGRVVQSAEEYRRAIEQTATGRGRPDVDTLLAQNRGPREAAIRAAERQQQFQLQTQLPAQAALAHLAAPTPAIGTGIVAANADEQAKIVAGQQRSVELQGQLNDYYAQGKQILIDTYKVPVSLINAVQSIGAEIASTQAGIRNEQAAYQVAQYNFQLRIARRTLSDIGGLTGKNFGEGKSYLGVLEKQNLALSRQGQQLQFNLSQRQINFQTALAGFQTPGVTPEERQARVKEAQIEASFAQKQLDISKQIFGNQVQIVDISNLRQGADLAAQIGLLLQGRQVTIDTAVAEEKLIRLQQLQAKQVAQVSTYLQKVDNLAGQAMGEIQALEAAAGKALYGVAAQVLNAYSLVIRGLTRQLNGAISSQTSDQPGKSRDDDIRYNAVGAVGTTTGTTNMVMGEAGAETYAILRNPRAVMGSLGGGGSVTVTFGDVYVRSDNDINEIARKVTQVMGREASLKGLRSGS